MAQYSRIAEEGLISFIGVIIRAANAYLSNPKNDFVFGGCGFWNFNCLKVARFFADNSFHNLKNRLTNQLVQAYLLD